VGAAADGFKLLRVGLDVGELSANDVDPQIDAAHAVTVAEPAASPKACPRLLASLVTLAMALFEELHTAEANVCVLLSLKVPVAVNICDVPAGIDGLRGLTTMETSPGETKVAAEYSSALAEELRVLPSNSRPSATRTIPFFKSVAVCCMRAVFKVPAALKAPGEAT
jgi:hypothetical protein